MAGETKRQATVPLTRGVHELCYQRFIIEVVEGPDVGQTARAEATELSIGTAAGNALTLTDKTVSRHHCSVTVGPDGFLLRDLGSRNSTRLAGYRVGTAYLTDGTTFELGRSKLLFKTLEESLRQPLSEKERFGGVLGRSDAMREVFALLPRIAAAQSTVLIEGETGTGKGLLADAIHGASPRAEGPIIVIDCGSIPHSLAQSELFGHVKGAFTGAQSDRAGAFESAHGGTVFLDEVGELPLDMQPKLLRALEERTIKRVGATERIALDVRVIAATHRDLREAVNSGAFRSDLYYRLNVVRIVIPPLRERRDDVELLTRHFYQQFSPEQPKPPQALITALRAQRWAGNVRELRSAVERAVLLGSERWSDGRLVATSSAQDTTEFDASVSFREAKEQATVEWERGYLIALLQHAGGNVSKAAREARMDRNHLRELLRKHEINVRAYVS